MSDPRSRLQQEIQQNKPFGSPAEEALLALLRTADVVRSHGAQTLGPHGLTLQQYNVLRILRGAGEPGLPTLDVAERMIEQAPGITRLLERLEKKRLVWRKRCRRDRRQVLAWITPEGLERLRQLEAPVLSAQARFAVLSPRDLRTLVRLLEALRSAHSSSDIASLTQGEPE